MSVNVYVDGFNLYNGMFKKKRAPDSSKWLDLGAIATTVWPHLGSINKVRYFTARVKATPLDPLITDRQDVYLRALQATGTTVHLGQFKRRCKKWYLDAMATTIPASMGGAIVDLVALICKYEEKGSDVNLGAYLVRDAAVRDCSIAVVISNDSDLVEAIKITQADFAVPVYIINPHLRATAELTMIATASRDLAPSALAKSQLPNTVTVSTGRVITRPPSWT